MTEPRTDSESENDYLKMIHHLQRDAGITVVILKTHLLVESEINEILALLVNHPNELEKASLTFHQKIFLLRALLPSRTHHDLYAAEMLNRLRNKIAHNLDPQGLEDSIRTFLSSNKVHSDDKMNAKEIQDRLITALCRLHGSLYGYKTIILEDGAMSILNEND